MDAVYETRWKTMYHAECFVGLDPEFMVKAHLLIPEGEENLLYNWMLNNCILSTSKLPLSRCRVVVFLHQMHSSGTSNYIIFGKKFRINDISLFAHFSKSDDIGCNFRKNCRMIRSLQISGFFYPNTVPFPPAL